MFIADDKLDFHEYGLLTEYEVEQILIQFIEDSHIKMKDKLLIIVGKGKFVRPKVAKLLLQNKLVKNFDKAGYFNGQDGAFEVYLY